MNIRIGKENDVQQGAALMQAYLKEIKFLNDKKLYPADYYIDLCKAAVKDKSAIIAEENGQIIGVLFGVIMPNYLVHEQQLQILMAWVRPNKRGSSAFIRMFKLLKKQFGNSYDIVFKEIKETNINYTKLKLKKIETSYILTKENN